MVEPPNPAPHGDDSLMTAETRVRGQGSAGPTCPGAHPKIQVATDVFEEAPNHSSQVDDMGGFMFLKESFGLHSTPRGRKSPGLLHQCPHFWFAWIALSEEDSPWGPHIKYAILCLCGL